MSLPCDVCSYRGFNRRADRELGRSKRLKQLKCDRSIRPAPDFQNLRDLNCGVSFRRVFRRYLVIRANWSRIRDDVDEYEFRKTSDRETFLVFHRNGRNFRGRLLILAAGGRGEENVRQRDVDDDDDNSRRLEWYKMRLEHENCWGPNVV